MFYSYTESKHLKIYPIGQPPINASKFLLLSLQSLLQKDACGYAKVIHEKRKKQEKRIEKMDKFQENKTMGTLMAA
jgi:hypothetical protein